jgi:N-acyl-L-homoserine lactone synthetase
MATLAECISTPLRLAALREMFEARKRVFVDILKWDVPVLEDRFEIDQFDDEHATYLIVPDEQGFHAGSARLLKTVRPHILDSLFPELCDKQAPSGDKVLEITRFCLDPGRDARVRLETRNRLVSALVRYALDHGIETYTGVAEMGWLQQILAFGWKCRPLGFPRERAGKLLGALRIDISEETPRLLEENGIYRHSVLRALEALEAA